MVPHREHAVVEADPTLLCRDDTSSIELEGPLVGLDGNGNRLGKERERRGWDWSRWVETLASHENYRIGQSHDQTTLQGSGTR